MKKIKLIFVCMLFFVIAIAVTRCNDSGNINSNNNEEINFDTPGDRVLINIWEYVLVTPESVESYYEWRFVGGVQCQSTCFSPPTILTDSVTTPPSQRFEGENLVETQFFKIEYGSEANCLSGLWASYFKVYKTSTYFQEWHQFGNKPCDPPNPSGTYEDDYLNDTSNVNLPSNSTIYIDYGVDVLTDNISKK